MTKICLTSNANSIEKINRLKLANQGKYLLKYLLKISEGQPIDKPTFEKLLSLTQNTTEVYPNADHGIVINGYAWYLSKKFKPMNLVHIEKENVEPSRTSILKETIEKQNELIKQLQEALAEKNDFNETFKEEENIE